MDQITVFYVLKQSSWAVVLLLLDIYTSQKLS